MTDHRTPIEAPPCPELVERVARAIAYECDIDPDVFIGMHGRSKWEKQWHPMARAAIEATRPTAATDDVVAAAAKLVAKLDECAPHIENLSVVDYVRRGTQYTGPSYGEALEELRTVLARTGVTLNG